MLTFTFLFALAPMPPALASPAPAPSTGVGVAALQLTRRPGGAVDTLDPVADCAGSASAPGYVGAVDLSLIPALYGCDAGSPAPWSGCWSPDGSYVYLTLFGGGLGASNCRVAKLDAQTLLPVGSFEVGLSPEEIVFTTTPAGGLEYGFVTNSTESSVTVFDASDQVVATVPIPVQPGDPFGTAFPFGMAVAPDGSHVYVGTNDGSGNVHVLDVGTLALDPSETLAFGPDHGFGRMATVGDTLVLTVTVFHPGFQGSTAEVAFVDLAGGTVVEHVLASSPDASAFPTPIDVAVWCERVYVSGFDLGPQVFELDAATAELRGTIPTLTSNRLGKLHALGVDSDGLLVVADFFTGEVAWIDAARREVLSVFDTTTVPDYHANLNDVVFAPDGSRLFLTGQGSSSLAVFGLP